MINRLNIVLLCLALMLCAASLSRAAGVVPPGTVQAVPAPSDVDVLKMQVAQLQKQVAALDKRVGAVEGPVNDYRSSPCRPTTGIPITEVQKPLSSPVDRLVLCAIML